MERYTYLLVNVFCIIIPLAASFYKKHAFYKNWPTFFKANIIVAALFIFWDIIFTQIGVWRFNPTYLTGFYIINLPIEEILFFICIPFACVFSYFAFKFLVKNNPLITSEKWLSYALAILLLVLAITHVNKLYTCTTFLCTSLFLFYLKKKKINLSYYYLSYFFILPFFFLSNGILTGSFLVKPIVWYNDAENLGIRLFNIPVEDTIYGLLLIFCNIYLYDHFKQKNHL